MSTSLTVTLTPRSFMSRPEFQPRAPAADGGREWLPLHPFFETAAEEFEREPSPARTAAGARRLAGLFRAVEERWRLSPEGTAMDNLVALEDPRTRMVITGQQPGFLAGPLFTVYKAISAVAAARFLQARTGIRHVPVFWVASEDHDLDEARALHFPGPDGSLEFALPHPADRRPLSAYPVDAAVEEVMGRVSREFSGRRHDGLVEELIRLYPGRGLAGGFAALMTRLFAPQGLLIMEPETLRPAAQDIFRRAILEPQELLARIREGIQDVKENGHKVQVPARFPLFLLHEGKRQHLAPEEARAGEGRFRLEGTTRSFTGSELLSLLKSEPGRFSSGVLLRPVIQNALLPNAVYIGGPAEIAYFRQLGPVFQWFGLPPPRIALRFSATLVEGKVARAMRRLDLLEGPEGPDHRWVRATGPGDLLRPLSDGPEEVLKGVPEKVRAQLMLALGDARIPSTQKRRLENLARKIADDIDGFGARAARAARLGEADELTVAKKLYENFFPGGVLQERKWNILYYISKYGSDWISELVDLASRDPFRIGHHWVFFEEASRP